jgi:hypothetical protein
MDALFSIANTLPPDGYSESALYLRRWLLDLKLRLAAIPAERQRMLERTLYEFNSNGKSGYTSSGVPTRVRSNAYLLARAAAG